MDGSWRVWVDALTNYISALGFGSQDDAKYRETLERLVLDFPGSPYVPVARGLLAELSTPSAESGVH